jgi:hypothetical protein
VLERPFPAPLHLDAQRTFILDSSAARLKISDRLKRGETPGLPAAPWSVLHVRRPARLVLPRPAEDAPGAESVRLRRSTLAPDALRVLEAALVIQLRPEDELYLEPPATTPWIGLEIGRQLLVFIPGEGPGALRFFADQGRPGAEIERVPDPMELPPGAMVLQRSELRLGAVRPGLTDAQLALQARRLADDGDSDPHGYPVRRPSVPE